MTDPRISKHQQSISSDDDDDDDDDDVLRTKGHWGHNLDVHNERQAAAST